MPSEAEVVASSRPEVPPCPEMWLVQYWEGGEWRAGICHKVRSFIEAVYTKQRVGYRLIRIPPETPPAQGKESPCSNESQDGGNGSVAASGGTTNRSTPSSTSTAGASKDTNAVPNAADASNPPACKPEPKDGVRPLADWSNAKTTPIYKPARPDTDKVKWLCKEAEAAASDCEKHPPVAVHAQLLRERAREVLAQLEGA